MTTQMAAVNVTTAVVESPVPFATTEKCGAKIAILDVDGLLVNTNLNGVQSLGENPVSAFREKLDAIRSSQDVDAVVLRINTPGGGVTATDIMWQDLRQFRQQTHLPVVACLMDLGTGGGYYLASQADSIIAHPTTVTGGIGVVLNLYNLEDLQLFASISTQPITAGEQILTGSQTRKLPEAEKKVLTGMAQAFHERFKEVVKTGRGNKLGKEPKVFDGRVLTASEAMEQGLVDRIGYLDDAVNEASALSGKGVGEVVLYHRTNDQPFSVYAVSPNVPLQGSLMPVSIPGIERSRLPGFLYIWQVDPTLERMTGR